MAQSTIPDTTLRLKTTDQAQAFEKAVKLIRSHGVIGWWHDHRAVKSITTLVQAAGFDAVLHNTMVSFDPKTGVAKKVVMVYPNSIGLVEGPTVGGEMTFHNIGDAVAAIYGVNDL